jgi:hypothetical protein
LRPHIGIEQFTQRFATALPQLGYPEIGFTVEGTQIRLEIPQLLRVTHEEHFAAVRDEFLTMLDSGVEPKNLRGNLLSKYLLLANARETAMG